MKSIDWELLIRLASDLTGVDYHSYSFNDVTNLPQKEFEKLQIKFFDIWYELAWNSKFDSRKCRAALAMYHAIHLLGNEKYMYKMDHILWLLKQNFYPSDSFITI